MNGIDKITARIEMEAVAEAARIDEAAKADCERIRAEGEKQAQESYWEKVRQGVAATEDRVQRLAKTADMEARKSVLGYKQTLVAGAFDQAEARLRALTGDEYVAFLSTLAARAAVTGTEEIILSAKDKTEYGQAVLDKANSALTANRKTGKLTLSDQDGAFDGGLICRQGSVSVNCTIDALMAQAREDMAADVAAMLFG